MAKSKQESTQEKHWWMTCDRWKTIQYTFLLNRWTNTSEQCWDGGGFFCQDLFFLLFFFFFWSGEPTQERDLGKVPSPGKVLAEDRPCLTQRWYILCFYTKNKMFGLTCRHLGKLPEHFSATGTGTGKMREWQGERWALKGAIMTPMGRRQVAKICVLTHPG